MTARSVDWKHIEPLLADLGWTKRELSVRTGLSRNTVGRWVRVGAPVWTFRLLHLEVESRRHEVDMENLRRMLKVHDPVPAL